MNVRDCFQKGLLVKSRPSIMKAERSLTTAAGYIKKAKDNLKLKNYDISVVAAYTAMFHSLRTLLFKDGIKERSHVCLLRYVKEKYLELAKQTNSIDSYRRFRHTALYGLDILVDRSEAEGAIEVAEETRASVKKLLVGRAKG